eukprot:s42_g16.t1
MLNCGQLCVGIYPSFSWKAVTVQPRRGSFYSWGQHGWLYGILSWGSSCGQFQVNGRKIFRHPTGMVSPPQPDKKYDYWTRARAMLRCEMRESQQTGSQFCGRLMPALAGEYRDGATFDSTIGELKAGDRLCGIVIFHG